MALPFYTDDYLRNELKITDEVAIAAWGALKAFLVREENKEWQAGAKVHNPEKAFRMLAQALREINKIPATKLFPTDSDALNYKWNLQLIIYLQLMALYDGSPRFNWNIQTRKAQALLAQMIPKFVRREMLAKKRQGWKKGALLIFAIGLIIDSATAASTLNEDVSSPGDKQLAGTYTASSAFVVTMLGFLYKWCQKNNGFVEITREIIADLNQIYPTCLPQIALDDSERTRQSNAATKEAIRRAFTEKNEVKGQQEVEKTAEGFPEEKIPEEKFCCTVCHDKEAENEEGETETNLYFLQIDQKADGQPIGFYGPFHHCCATKLGVVEPILKRPIPLGIAVETQEDAGLFFKWRLTLPSKRLLQEFLIDYSQILKREQEQELQEQKERSTQQQEHQRKQQETEILGLPDPASPHPLPFDTTPTQRWVDQVKAGNLEGESHSEEQKRVESVESKEGEQQKVGEDSDAVSFASMSEVLESEVMRKWREQFASKPEGEEEGVDFLDLLSSMLSKIVGKKDSPQPDEQKVQSDVPTLSLGRPLPSREPGSAISDSAAALSLGVLSSREKESKDVHPSPVGLSVASLSISQRQEGHSPAGQDTRTSGSSALATVRRAGLVAEDGKSEHNPEHVVTVRSASALII